SRTGRRLTSERQLSGSGAISPASTPNPRSSFGVSHRFRSRRRLLEATTLARRPRRRDDAHHSPALFRALLRLPADLREQLVRLRAHRRRVAAALDVEPEQRLGIRGAQVETPVVELDADAVDVLDPLRTRRVLLLDAPHRRRGVFDAP